jgi:DNA-binding SARP family transcriptional activator
VVAAQIAVRAEVAQFVWVTAASSSSVGDDMGCAAGVLRGQPLAAGAHSEIERQVACHRVLRDLPDDQPALIVFDDASWVGDAEALAVLEAAIGDAPDGSLVVVTTRVECRDVAAHRGSWVLEPAQLALTDLEISELWARQTLQAPGVDLVKELACTSGRHAALLSLMARNSSLMGESTLALVKGASVASLLDELVATQLNADERNLLDVAATLGRGQVAVLKRMFPSFDVERSIRRVADVLPLVSLGGRRGIDDFVVHDLVRETRRAAERVHSRDPLALDAVLKQLTGEGRASQALDIAIDCRDLSRLSDFLCRFGSGVLSSTSWQRVDDALNLLGPAGVVASPRLLSVKAEADWVAGRRAQAIQTAQLAVRMEEVSGSREDPAEARALLASMRAATADLAGVASEVAPLLEDNANLSSDRLADVLYSATVAYALQADLAGLARCDSAAAVHAASRQASDRSLARLDSAQALVALVLEGDPLKALRYCRRAHARPGLPSHSRMGARDNVAVALIECGDTDAALEVLASDSMGLEEHAIPLDEGLQRVIAAVPAALAGRAYDALDVASDVLRLCEDQGEYLTLVLTCQMAAQAAVATGQSSQALELSERGLRGALETGSPVLAWLMELTRALALLSMGDTEPARLAALRILPQAEAAGAVGHVMRARLLIAEADLRDGGFGDAVQRLIPLVDPIVNNSPAFLLACHVRAFPELLAPLVRALGVGRVPVRVLHLLSEDHCAAALAAAEAGLSGAELRRLKARMDKDVARRRSQEAAEAAKPVVCEVRLLGGLHVRAPHGVVSERDWTKRKSRLLFSMLVARGGTDVPRGEIIEYLWPDMDEERGLSNFYVVWSAMKRALSPRGSDQSSPFVQHAHGVCRIVGENVISDLDQFKAATSRARAAHADRDPQAELAALRQALELYRGDVLPGDVYDDWFGAVRERFKHDYEDAALRAGRLFTELGEPLEGLSVLRAASEHNPWREDIYQEILRLQIDTGQRAAAIETYLACRSRLVDDLGIDPSRETVALYEQVLGMEEAAEWQASAKDCETQTGCG